MRQVRAASSIWRADAVGTGLGISAVTHDVEWFSGYAVVFALLLMLLGATIGWKLRGVYELVARQLEDKKEEEHKPVKKTKTRLVLRGKNILEDDLPKDVLDELNAPRQTQAKGVWISFAPSAKAVYPSKENCGCRGAVMSQLRVCRRCERED